MKTPDIEKIINQILQENCKKNYEVIVNGPGGDHDTDNIVIIFSTADDEDQQSLHICGFDHQKCLKDTTDWKTGIEMIEMTDGQDSEGGLNHDTGDIVPVYHALRKKFRDMGYDVVRTMDEYF